MLVPIAGLKFQGLLITRNTELSAFLVIVWCTYREKSTLKFSALIRRIITEATIYFLAMVALQIYIQVSLVLTEVWSLSSHSIS